MRARHRSTLEMIVEFRTRVPDISVPLRSQTYHAFFQRLAGLRHLLRCALYWLGPRLAQRSTIMDGHEETQYSLHSDG